MVYIAKALAVTLFLRQERLFGMLLHKGNTLVNKWLLVEMWILDCSRSNLIRLAMRRDFIWIRYAHLMMLIQVHLGALTGLCL